MGEKAAEFRRRGLGVAAVTYDSVDILHHFAGRTKLAIPLLSDQGSNVIRAFGILNTSVPADSPIFGVPYPGTYVVDRDGRVLSKHFEEDYRERTTAGAILVRDLDAPGGGAAREVATRHLKLRATSSNDTVYAGSRVTLILDIHLPPRMHLYAPGVTGYKPVAWEAAGARSWRALAPAWPAPRTLHLPAINETVPVFTGRFRVTRDIVLGMQNDLAPALSPSRTLTIEGVFRYQACDDRTCYQPESLPLRWTLTVAPFDRERVPAPLRKVGG